MYRHASSCSVWLKFTLAHRVYTDPCAVLLSLTYLSLSLLYLLQLIMQFCLNSMVQEHALSSWVTIALTSQGQVSTPLQSRHQLLPFWFVTTLQSLYMDLSHLKWLCWLWCHSELNTKGFSVIWVVHCPCASPCISEFYSTSARKSPSDWIFSFGGGNI